MTSRPSPSATTQALERLGTLSLRESSMDDLLRTVVELARDVMPGDVEASVSLLVSDAPATAVSTAEFATSLDERQYERDHGPCLHAARTGELTEITDTRTEERWPDYARRAAREGNLSSLSIPLVVDADQRVFGALNLYARKPDAFDADSRAAAVAFGSYAAVAAGNLHAFEDARSRGDHLAAALESRAVIEQAKGILMERLKLTADQAFQLLARVSMETNRKVRDVAENLVHTGELATRQSADGHRPTAGRSRARSHPPGDATS